MSLLSAAVHNNAAWCDAVCRALGGDTTRVDGLWVNRSPAPPFYPNVVTLEPTDTSVLLARVRSMLDSALPRPWAVKDSFQRLDLAPLGFEILFKAEWIGLPADRPVPEQAVTAPVWVTVRREADLVEWERAWRGQEAAGAVEAGVGRLFQPALLADPDIRFLAWIRDGKIVAGVIANCSDDGTGPVVGISNLVLTQGALATDGPAVLAAVREAFPGLPIVGYERGDDLIAMLALGFRFLGVAARVEYAEFVVGRWRSGQSAPSGLHGVMAVASVMAKPSARVSDG